MMKLIICISPLFFFSALEAKESLVKAQIHEGWLDLLVSDKSTDTGLKHWRNVNVDKSTFRFSSELSKEKSPILICTGKPTGLIRSAEAYENFMLEFSWRHMTCDKMRANAGFFIWSDGLPAKGTPFSRSIELQVANFQKDSDWFTSQGDVFAIHGAKMKVDPRFGSWARGMRSLPLEVRANPTGEWNHYRVLCIDGTIQLEVNGKVVSGGYQASPRKGHLMIESEGGEVHFKNMRLLPLPSSDYLKLEDVAEILPASTTITSLYNGINLEGWNVSEGAKIHTQDYALVMSSGKISRSLNARKGRLIIDWKSKAKQETLPFSLDEKGTLLPASTAIPKGSNRAMLDLNTGEIKLNGKSVTRVNSETIKQLKLHSSKEVAFYNNVLLLEE